VESNSDESTSNHDTVKSDYLDEFYGPFIPIHILEEDRTKREHADYINIMEILFTINPHPTNDNTSLLDAVGITASQVYVNTTLMKKDFKYLGKYCKLSRTL
nr:hypothetical protein [Tanacetum cinerariifolium]